MTAGKDAANCSRWLRRHHKVESACNVWLQLLPRHHGVEHAVVKQELAALETLRKLLTNGLFNHAGPGKTNQGARFGDIEVSQHSERRRDTARGWIGENGNIRHLGLIKSSQRSRN